jgi:peptidyl-prolyl cis-trans isomerase SurA
VSDPVQVPNAVVLFQLREIAEDPAFVPTPSLVEYARLTIPDDPALIAEIRSKSDRCVDLNAFARGQPDEALVIEKQPLEAIPQDIAIELAQLDAGESSVALARGGQRLFLMLCGREPVIAPAPADAEAAPDTAAATDEPAPEPEINRDAIRERLLNAKAQGQSEALLEELRAAAIIEVR